MMSTNDNGRARAAATGVNCVQCGASPATPAYAPFCSRRCADIDLHRWLTEGYAIPAAEDDETDDPFDDETSGRA
ncbi:MAG: DNA gyrase inhibitor YacG [Alphaproteobacteria bacterium]|nr:DNA gyrase inhibitor YacG [Alphaproteobacteria bacterium]